MANPHGLSTRGAREIIIPRMNLALEKTEWTQLVRELPADLKTHAPVVMCAIRGAPETTTPRTSLALGKTRWTRSVRGLHEVPETHARAAMYATIEAIEIRAIR
jgi:hypothetical protein